MENIVKPHDVGEINEHSVGFIRSHGFYLQLVKWLTRVCIHSKTDSTMLDTEKKKGKKCSKQIERRKLKKPLEELQEDVFDPNGFLVDEVPAAAIAVHFFDLLISQRGISKQMTVSEKDNRYGDDERFGGKVI